MIPLLFLPIQSINLKDSVIIPLLLDLFLNFLQEIDFCCPFTFLLNGEKKKSLAEWITKYRTVTYYRQILNSFCYGQAFLQTP